MSRHCPSGPGRPGRGGGWARALTLAELLVVVALIALLVAIIVPVLQRAREQAYDAPCRANGVFNDGSVRGFSPQDVRPGLELWRP